MIAKTRSPQSHVYHSISEQLHIQPPPIANGFKRTCTLNINSNLTKLIRELMQADESTIILRPSFQYDVYNVTSEALKVNNMGKIILSQLSYVNREARTRLVSARDSS